MERDRHCASEDDAANAASLQPVQGGPKQCKFNAHINIANKQGSSPLESLKVPSAKFFFRYLQESIDFLKCWARGVTCSHCNSLPVSLCLAGLLPHHCGGNHQLSFSSIAWLRSGCCCLHSPPARHNRYFLYVFAQKAVFVLLVPLCWVRIISVL